MFFQVEHRCFAVGSLRLAEASPGLLRPRRGRSQEPLVRSKVLAAVEMQSGLSFFVKCFLSISMSYPEKIKFINSHFKQLSRDEMP